MISFSDFLKMSDMSENIGVDYVSMQPLHLLAFGDTYGTSFITLADAAVPDAQCIGHKRLRSLSRIYNTLEVRNVIV